MAFPSMHLSVTIARSPDEVVAFAGDPANLPRWAAGLSSGIRNENGRWLAESPQGEVEVRFTGGAEHGILDHEVLLPDGSRVFSPLRAFENDDAAELVFTLYRLPGMSDDDFRADAELVRGDLERLRDLLEGGD